MTSSLPRNVPILIDAEVVADLAQQVAEKGYAVMTPCQMIVMTWDFGKRPIRLYEIKSNHA